MNIYHNFAVWIIAKKNGDPIEQQTNQDYKNSKVHLTIKQHKAATLVCIQIIIRNINNFTEQTQAFQEIWTVTHIRRLK